MAVKIRLQRKGRKKDPFYHIVIADSRSPRDGRFIEKIGYYNPTTQPASIEIDRERAFYWLDNGAQPTDTVNAILRYKGVLYKKHLQRGVKKGALSQEQADEKLAAFIDQKENKIAQHVERTAQAKQDYLARVFGTPKVRKSNAPAEAPAAEATEEATETTEG
jgi:small subunit ribosomal protein S16